jgi:hypothetical protein
MSDEQERTIKKDPYSDLRAVMRGSEPDAENSGWVYREGVVVVPVDSDRNLWDLYIADVCVVTFDADVFPTTADLGHYIDGVIRNMTTEGETEDEDEDPRQLGAGTSRSFQ